MGSLYDVRGRIFDIQRYSIHDGPGIRTIVFLKGCFLRCRWCCNPESQAYDIEKVTVDGKPKVYGRDVTVGEVMDTVMKDASYYRRTGGGLTLSGGECLGQPDFAAALLEAAHENGMTTAIESTAFAPFETIEQLLPHLDYYLMDIKHMDSDKHKEFTGRPNELILANAARLAKRLGRRLVIRVPVVPTFNATEADVLSIARFADSLPGVEKIHLLPYHRLGMDKYARLGREYALSGISPLPAGVVEGFCEAVRANTSLECILGG
jgi:pyruvate formate lyase activating enzyme